MKYRKFQATAYLAASTFAAVFSLLTISITLIYLLGNIIMSHPGMASYGGGIGYVIFFTGISIVKFVPIIIGWVTTTNIGAFLYLFPPFNQALMSIIPAIEQGLQNQESTGEALNMRLGIGKRDYCLLPGFLIFGNYDMSSGDLSDLLKNHKMALNVALDYVKRNKAAIEKFTGHMADRHLLSWSRLNRILEERGHDRLRTDDSTDIDIYINSLEAEIRSVTDLQAQLEQMGYLPHIRDSLEILRPILTQIWTTTLPPENGFNLADDATIFALLDEYEINVLNTIDYIKAHRNAIINYTNRQAGDNIFGWKDLNAKLKAAKKEQLRHGRDIEHYLDVMHKEVIGKELISVRTDIEGRIYIGRVTLVMGIILLTALCWFYSMGYISFSFSLFGLSSAILAAASSIWTILGVTQLVLDSVRKRLGVEREPLLRIRSLPLHTLRLLKMALTMPDYFSHMFVSGLLNIHNLFNNTRFIPPKTEGKWERGRQSVVSEALGEKKSDKQRKSYRKDLLYAYSRNRLWVTLLLLLSVIPIIYYPMQRKLILRQRDLWTSIVKVTEYEPYLRGKVEWSGKNFKSTYENIAKYQGKDP
ncbi:MAG: hypothetical protein Q8R48_02625, partial [Candidatus Omnitrophota bacterium]|nr:hypothetical protein [Candidatus Omnitrophota bacterium]